MDEKTELNQELVQKKEWTTEQKEFIKNIMEKINSALAERFSHLASNMKLDYILPDAGIKAKIKASYTVGDNIHLGDLQAEHLLHIFTEEPETSKKLLRNVLNDHATMLYEKVISSALTEHLNNLLKQNEQYEVKDAGLLTQDGRVIVPSGHVPENKILMHPSTLEKLKQKTKVQVDS